MTAQAGSLAGIHAGMSGGGGAQAMPSQWQDVWRVHAAHLCTASLGCVVLWCAPAETPCTSKHTYLTSAFKS
jgi:hypothetical protein